MDPGCQLNDVTGRWTTRRHRDRWIPGVYSGDKFETGKVALTFDDGPHPSKTPILLDALKERGAKATFFIVGRNLRANTYSVVRRTLEEGHTLGNHTYQHDVELASRGGSAARSYIEAEFWLTQAMLDIILLAESPAQFEELVGRLQGGDPMRRPSPGTMVKRLPQMKAAHAEIMKEFNREPDEHPYHMVLSRGPNGYPALGKFSTRERDRFSEVVRGLGLVNVMYHRNDVGGVPRAFAEVLESGGVLVTHDWGKPEDVRATLISLGDEGGEQIVSLEDYISQKYGCSLPTLHRAIRESTETGASVP
ncbi:MAG: polysaccharide deacetylase family protein [Nannocystaceae bacterium]